MPQKTGRKKASILGCVFLGLGMLVLAGGVIFVLARGIAAAPRSFSVTQSDPPLTDAYMLSAEQQDLVAQLGYPEAFTILFYEQDQGDRSPQAVRLEIWTYYQAGQEVTLLNGQVIEQVEVERLLVSPATRQYRPEQFAAGMDSQAALRAAGLQEVISAPLETEGLPGGELLFGEQIAFGFQGESLAYVESFLAESEVQP